MTGEQAGTGGWQRFVGLCEEALRKLVLGLRAVSALGLVVMVLVTSLDVLLRVFGFSFTGAYDVVRIAAVIAVAAGLPYTTAVKGHVAIEFIYHKLSRRGRIITDTIIRLVIIGLFALLALGCVDYGNSLRAKGEVSMTLQLPVFWVPYVLGLSCVLVVLITVYHILHPGREMIKP
ncbi:MAG: TRAP transporter small permease [Verrucomicrobiia bacterium]|nr:TRAP transporter small permease [Verrucomicrobiota bacterium]